ncbi:MAG: type II toxin-antitoxin system prevent-host-death family antitoxin [Novosphingobium sp.]|nr:type II toxin-antitoxin system prevent-host-death family antitoxin [Novosphingobium sp.]
MKMSVREIKAKISEAIAAAERGESTTITKHGKVVAELNPPRKKSKINLAAGDAYLKSINWNPEGLDLWPPEFDDPAFSRKVLGLED